MKKGLIIATTLVGIAGGFGIAQTTLFGSAQNESFISAADAKTAALKAFNGTVKEFEYDHDDITPHYEFEIRTATEKADVEVDATTGEAIITERKPLKTKVTQTNTTVPTQSTVNAQATKPATTPVQNTQTTQATPVAKQVATTSTPQANFLTQDEAIAIAKTKASGTVTKAKLDYEDGIQVYEIDIVNGNTKYEVDVNATTGAIVKFSTDVKRVNTNPNANQQKPATTATNVISKADAIAIALQKASGTVTKAKLDTDDGIQVYEIELREGNTEYEFEINAVTGAIIEFSTDYENDNDYEDDDRYDD